MLYFIPHDVEILSNGNTKKIVVEKKIHKMSKKRCNLIICKKKLKLTDLSCNCNFRFCMKHRLPELHHCTQNFKEKNREKYLNNVILGGGEVIKIDKI